MSIIDAIIKANAFLLEKKGVHGEPDFVRLISKPGEARAWWVSYHFSLFDSSVARDGIDGGDYIVLINDVDGEATVFIHD